MVLLSNSIWLSLVILMFLATNVQCQSKKDDFSTLLQNGQNLYLNDHQKFFKIFNQKSSLAEKCNSKQDVIDFFSYSKSFSGNAEIEEAYSETIEKLATSNPKCFLDALLSSRYDFQKSILNRIKSPIFFKKELIYSRLAKFKKIEKYKVIFTQIEEIERP